MSESEFRRQQQENISIHFGTLCQLFSIAESSFLTRPDAEAPEGVAATIGVHHR